MNTPNKKIRHLLSDGLSLPGLMILTFLLFLASVSFTYAQQQEAVKAEPVRSTFGSVLLIDNQTVMVPFKGTFEFDIQHRFGTFRNGFDDLFGLYANSNIRLGLSYVPIENLMVGVGLTKFKNLVDFSGKYALLKQAKSGGSPVSLTYYGNIALDSRDENDREEVYNSSDRLSYFHQLIIARKISRKISIQVAPSLSHYNIIETEMENDHFAVAFSGRVMVSPTASIIANVDQPITKHQQNNPNPNLSLGIEMTTSSHAFQIFVGNYNSLVPQENNVFNNRDYTDGFKDNFLLGFNITRLWNF